MFKDRQRRRLIVLSVATCSLAVLAGCASTDSDSGSSSPQTVRFLGHTTMQAPMEALIEQFEEANPDITVNATFAPSGSQYGQTLITQVQAGNAPDVFYVNGGTGATESLIPLAEAGDLLDLSDQPFADEIPEAARDLYTVDGKVYGQLMSESPNGILYNETLATSLGIDVPTSFDEVLEVCAEATSAGLYGFAFSGQSSGFTAQVLAANLVYTEDPDWNAQRSDGEVTFADTDGWQEALQQLVDMYDAGCFEPGAESATVPASIELLTSGKAVMTILPSGTLGALESATAGTDTVWAMAAFPGSTPETTLLPVGYQGALAVSADTEVEDAALAFVNFIAGEGAQEWADQSGTISLQDAAEGNFPESMTALVELYENGQIISRPQESWNGGGALNALNVGVVEVMTGQKDIAAALESVDQAWGD